MISAWPKSGPLVAGILNWVLFLISLVETLLLCPAPSPSHFTVKKKKKKLKETNTIPPLNIKCEAGTLIWRAHWKPQTQISKRTGLAGVSTELWGKKDYNNVFILLLKYFRGNQMMRLSNFWLQSKMEKSLSLCFTSMCPHVHLHTNIWNKNSENNATLRALWYILI